MPKPMVSVENLCKNFGEVEVVKEITFQIFRGEFFGLLGPNGAGKTTTIGMLTGLVEPASGRILIDGSDLSRNPLLSKAKMGFVPQAFALYPTLCALDNLAFFGRIYGLRKVRLKERMAAVLDLVGLGDRANQTVAAFSHGMKRRLNIAVGLLHEPDLLILDEPTVGVDTQSRNAILETLASLNRSGVTLLYTTHYMDEAERLCHRVGIMDEGKMMALDTPASLVRDLGTGIVSVEFNASPDHGLLNEIGQIGSFKAMDEQKRHLRLETKHPDRAAREVLDLMDERAGLLKTLDIIEPNLETVFIHLTGRYLRN
ncbi:MAG: ABC transporter ATP-binding protein [Desulfatiglandales bacterium]